MRVALFAVVLLAAFAAAQLGPNQCNAPASLTDSCTTYTDVAAATGEQCGICYNGIKGAGGASGNYNFYCADAETTCATTSGNTYPTCVTLNIVSRGEPCTSSNTVCSDSNWPIACLSGGNNNVCGSAGVFEAGQSCAATTFNDFLSVSNVNLVGCKFSQCVGGQCNVTSTGCQPYGSSAPGSTPAPPAPGQYCDMTESPSVARPRLAIGADCKNHTDGCTWDATCLVDARDSANVKYVCTKYGSGTLGSACSGTYICQGDLACVANSDNVPVCTAVVADGNACTFGQASQCDTSARPTSGCVCDYTNGDGICVGFNTGVNVVNAYVQYTECVQQNGCTLLGSPYYGSCVANNCASEYKKFSCATKSSKVKSLKRSNTRVKSICGSGSAATSALAVAAAFVAVLAMIMA
jgi:hypothetical protein